MTAAIEVLELKPATNCGNVRAFVKLRVGGFVVHGIKVIRQDGQRPWVALPQIPARKKADGSGASWFPVLEASKSLKARIDTVVLEAWQREQPRPPQRPQERVRSDPGQHDTGDPDRPFNDEIGF